MSKKKTNSQANTAPAVTGKVYDFCSKKKMILTIAICVVLALVAGIIIRGVHLAIEFKGGTLITYTYDGDIDTNAVERRRKSSSKSAITQPSRKVGKTTSTT